MKTQYKLRDLDTKRHMKHMISTLILALSRLDGQDGQGKKNVTDAAFIKTYLVALGEMYIFYEFHTAQVSDGISYQSNHHKRRNPRAWKTEETLKLLKHTVTDGFANAWGQLDPRGSLFERQEGLLRGLERDMSRFQCTNSSDRDEEEGPKAIWQCKRTSRMRIGLENYRARLRMSFHQLAALRAGLIHVANVQGEGANDRNIRCASDNGYVSSNISRSLLEQDIWILAAMWTGSQDTLDLTQDQDQQLQQLTALGGWWVRITDVRMTHVSLRNLNLFRKLGAEENLSNVMLVTSWWEVCDSEITSAREAELKSQGWFWSTMISQGCSHGQVAEGIVRRLLQTTHVTLKAQEPLVFEQNPKTGRHQENLEAVNGGMELARKERENPEPPFTLVRSNASVRQRLRLEKSQQDNRERMKIMKRDLKSQVPKIKPKGAKTLLKM
ncbi:hypothetical protein EDB80DRAFT_838243 [Ilyonectria destructans]|nr:hypothetical protein EDB80DRAFT_838243 [Ilyonectria destructans]